MFCGADALFQSSHQGEFPFGRVRKPRYQKARLTLIMPIITLATIINAPPAICFDAARDAQLHRESARATGERIVAGRDVGLWELNDEITFEGTHLGVRQRFSARVVAFRAPAHFPRRNDARRFRQPEPHAYFRAD